MRVKNKIKNKFEGHQKNLNLRVKLKGKKKTLTKGKENKKNGC
jgi:hypothetical protein